MEQSGVPSAAAKLPALHSTAAVDPATQKEPAGQGEHSAEPADEEKEPAAQIVHPLLSATA